jgi:hypothetical protein
MVTSTTDRTQKAHFVHVYHTFCGLLGHFLAQNRVTVTDKTGTKTEVAGIEAQNCPQTPRIAHNCRRSPAIPAKIRENAEIVHNCPQMPANPRQNQPNTGVFHRLFA